MVESSLQVDWYHLTQSLCPKSHGCVCLLHSTHISIQTSPLWRAQQPGVAGGYCIGQHSCVRTSGEGPLSRMLKDMLIQYLVLGDILTEMCLERVYFVIHGLISAFWGSEGAPLEMSFWRLCLWPPPYLKLTTNLHRLVWSDLNKDGFILSLLIWNAFVWTHLYFLGCFDSSLNLSVNLLCKVHSPVGLFTRSLCSIINSYHASSTWVMFGDSTTLFVIL